MGLSAFTRGIDRCIDLGIVREEDGSPQRVVVICTVLPEDSNLTRNGLEIFPSRSTISWLLGGARGGD